MKKPTRSVRRKNQPAAATPEPTPSPPTPVEPPQQERNLFRTILDKLPSIIFCKDKDGRYVFTNRAHQRVLGATEKTILGKTAFDFHPHDLARQYLEEEMQIMRTGEPLPPKEEPALHREKGKQRWHLTSRIPFKDKSGRVAGVFGISHDITERKQAEMKLNERMEELISWENITLGREARVMELKKEVNELLAELGKPPRYGDGEEGLSCPPPDNKFSH